MAIIYEKKDKIAYLTINRPEALNALDVPTWREVFAAIDDFRCDDDSWVMIVTGAGDKAFSVGVDLKSTISSLADGKAEEMKWTRETSTWFRDVYKPVIAAVNGFCFAGAMEMLLATDIRIASENAVFGQIEAKWGIFTSGGGTVRLVRHVSWCHAMELLLAAQMVTAQDAYRMGLVNRVVPLKDLMPTAEAMARQICQNGPLAVRAMKEAGLRSLSLPMEEALNMESMVGKMIFNTQDAKEGPRAFAEKRVPHFVGK
jgi:enoyl-CoA hydratase/carnithine racemase